MTCRRFALTVCLAAAAALPQGGPARAQDRAAGTELRRAMDQAFAAAERDHGKVRARDFAEKLGDFPERLRGPLAAARSDRASSVADDVEHVLAALRRSGGAPVSATSLRVILVVLLPPDPVPRAELTAAECRDEFVAAARDVFAADRFEDCWDASFRDIPEVVAWRAAHAPKPRDPPAGPVTAPRAEPGPPASAQGPGEAPGPSRDGTAPADADPAKPPELPSPFSPDASVNLLALDRGRGWVGPWTGWTQDVAEKENRRQKRNAKAVWIDRYETTCAEYLRFVRSVEPSKRRALLPVGWTLDERLEPSCPAGRERSPVTGVTYFQAQEYAESVGKRLPTEDEWDRAAGGGDKEGRAFPWGPAAAGRTWAFAGQGADAPVAVDAFPGDRTPEGVVGLAGNVAEIVATLPDRREVPAKVPANMQVVIRGGSWRTSRESDCGTTFRWVIDAGQGAPHVGFRCVMEETEYRRQFR